MRILSTALILLTFVITESAFAQRGGGARRSGGGLQGFRRGGESEGGGGRAFGGQRPGRQGGAPTRRFDFGGGQPGFRGPGSSAGGPGAARAGGGGVPRFGPGGASAGGRSGFSRGSSGFGRPDSGRTEFSRSRATPGTRPSPQTFNGNRSAYSAATPWRQQDRERMTIDLPQEYADLDTDLDGQIGLYEWVEFRRDELELFDEIDLDFDTMLTPREITAHKELVASAKGIAAALAEKYKRPRLTIVGANGVTTAGGPSDSNLTEEQQKRMAEASSRVFSAIDRDRDGKLSAEEIKSNPRIAPMFERAGLTITSMSKEEFSSVFSKAMEKMRGSSESRGGTARGGFGSGDRSGFGGGGRGGFGSGQGPGREGRGGFSFGGGSRESGGRSGFSFGGSANGSRGR